MNIIKLIIRGIAKWYNDGAIELLKSASRRLFLFQSFGEKYNICIDKYVLNSKYIRQNSETYPVIHSSSPQDYLTHKLTGYDIYNLVKYYTGFPEYGFTISRKMSDKEYPHLTIGSIGCGDGRYAGILQQLHPEIEYHGFDVDDIKIEELNKKFGQTNSFFHEVDVKNEAYNPDSTKLAKNYEFPVEDGKFDAISSFAVLIHIKADGMQNYIREMSRMINSNGKIIITLFIIENKSDLAGFDWEFPYEHDNHYSNDESQTLNAFDYDYVKSTCNQVGLEISEYVKGDWRGPNYIRDNTPRHRHDLLVLTNAE